MHAGSLKFMLCFVLLALPPGAAAQDWSMPWSDPRDRPSRFDISASAGVVLPTDWSDLVLLGTVSSTGGIFEQALVRDLRVEPSSVMSAAVTYWRGRYGFRTQGGLARSSLVGTGEIGPSVRLDTWFYDVRGAIGFLEYHPRRWVWPFVSFGFGGITYDLARTVSPPLLTFIDRGRARPAVGADVVVADDGREFLLAIDELGTETVFALNIGAGTDFRIPLGPAGLGLRLEVSDHIAPSPLGVAIEPLNRIDIGSAAAVRFRAVHHLRAAAGLVVQIGR